MLWNFKEDRPIYTQLIQQIEMAIISGEYKPGSKMQSVRDLAAEAGVNPNTMQRAMTELEQNGLLYTQRTAGRYITEDIEMIESAKKQIATQHIQEFLEAMNHLGLSKDEAIELIANLKEEE